MDFGPITGNAVLDAILSAFFLTLTGGFVQLFTSIIDALLGGTLL